jgi:hypothetical protein
MIKGKQALTPAYIAVVRLGSIGRVEEGHKE